MSQLHRDRAAASLASDGPANPEPDPKPDHLEIFSTPAVQLVFHWWLESNQRWAERNVTRTL
jgi:hypothetical protein